MATVRNLALPVRDWRFAGVPLAAMLSVDRDDHGRPVAVRVRPTPLDVVRPLSPARRLRADPQMAQRWLMDEAYANPGPIQFVAQSGGEEGTGDEGALAAVARGRALTLQMERTAAGSSHLDRVAEARACLAELQHIVRDGCASDVLDVALASLSSLRKLIGIVQNSSQRASLSDRARRMYRAGGSPRAGSARKFVESVASTIRKTVPMTKETEMRERLAP
jgi:hypothetical protein